MNTVVLLNLGRGTFAPPVFYASGDTFVTTADLDGDGDLDLVTSRSILRNRGNGTFDDPVFFSAGTDHRGVVAADLDGDARPDLAVVNEIPNAVSILFNRSAAPVSVDCDRSGVPDECELADDIALDLNGNGVLDVCDGGDFDDDGDVDLADYILFEACFGDAELDPPFSVCRFFDLDRDGDVDLADLLEFQAAFICAR